MSIQLTGSLDIQGSITGSLLGTASFATTASFALNSNITDGVPILSGSLLNLNNRTYVGGNEFNGLFQITNIYK